MTIVLDPFMTGVKPQGLQRGRGGFWRSADDAPYVTDPSGEVCKTGDRKGEVKRVKYGSPSNRGREIENDAALVKYRQRLSFLGIGMDTALAEACRDLALMDADSDEFKHAADKIAVEADKLTRSWLAADRGTHGHLLCEMHDRYHNIGPEFFAVGRDLGLDDATQRDTIIAWAKMLMYNGLEILAIEASCVDDKWRLAGTLDRIVRTTKPLIFAKSTGELVVIPANTVLVGDIKFGKCRLAHPIQIASYAQSVPYDTETETRGEWGFDISQEHALIFHGSFDPPSIELVWVDLVAGREHGGQCVVDAKAWAARDDVFSVAQIVEGAAEGQVIAIPVAPSTLPPVPPVPVAGEVEGDSSFTAPPSPALFVEGANGSSRGPDTERIPMPVDSPPSTRPPRLAATAAGEGVGPSPAPSPALSPELRAVFADAKAEWDALTAKRNTTSHPAWPLADPARLALVDARAALCASPDEGGDWSSDEFAPLWDELRGLFDDLGAIAKGWRSELAGQAKRRHVDFLAQGGKTERRYWINKAVICLALAGEGDDILRELLAFVIGEVALFAGVEAGHALGSLSAAEAERFAAHVDAYLSVPEGAA